MKYKIEVVSIEGGCDIIGYHEARTLKSAMKKANTLSLKYNKSGMTKTEMKGQESVWVEWQDKDGWRSHMQFINGEMSYRVFNYSN
jgi:hypothetical protein